MMDGLVSIVVIIHSSTSPPPKYGDVLHPHRVMHFNVHQPHSYINNFNNIKAFIALINQFVIFFSFLFLFFFCFIFGFLVLYIYRRGQSWASRIQKCISIIHPSGNMRVAALVRCIQETRTFNCDVGDVQHWHHLVKLFS